MRINAKKNALRKKKREKGKRKRTPIFYSEKFMDVLFVFSGCPLFSCISGGASSAVRWMLLLGALSMFYLNGDLDSLKRQEDKEYLC